MPLHAGAPARVVAHLQQALLELEHAVAAGRFGDGVVQGPLAEVPTGAVEGDPRLLADDHFGRKATALLERANGLLGGDVVKRTVGVEQAQGDENATNFRDGGTTFTGP